MVVTALGHTIPPSYLTDGVRWFKILNVIEEQDFHSLRKHPTKSTGFSSIFFTDLNMPMVVTSSFNLSYYIMPFIIIAVLVKEIIIPRAESSTCK